MAEERAAPSAPDLSSLLNGILAGGNGGGGKESGVASDILGDGIASVLRDPQMMAKLPDMVEMLKPLMGSMPSGGDRAEESVAAGKKEEGQDAPPAALLASASHHGGGKGGKGAHERRIALLCALRPYLNPRRQEAIDYILRMDKMGKLFRNG